MPNTILVDTVDGVTTITFNRPDQRNAMSPELHAEMVETLEFLRDDDGTEVVILTGAGEAFCAGQDLKKYFGDSKQAQNVGTKARQDSHDWRGRILQNFPKPTIAAINGYCFGGAFTIVGAVDVAIAADEAIFGLSEVNFGHIAGGMVTKVVMDNMIPRQGLFYIMTGRQFDGKKSAEIGFTTMSVPRADLIQTATDLAHELQGKDPLALRAAKEAYRSIDLRRMSNDEALAWLVAKADQLRFQQARRGDGDAIDRFIAKEFRPGFESASR